jgi:lysophospholipase L1-like esterase
MRDHLQEINSVRTSYSGRALMALTALLAAVGGCSDSNADVTRPTPPAAAPFMARYVALGNSLTAGFQSGGINDSTQLEAYPALIAEQVGLDYSVVLIPRTCVPPLVSFGGPPVNAPGPCAVGTPPAFVNNVAVPNSYASDLIARYPATAITALTSFLRGGESQVRRALDANPTFVSIWLGNNEVLAPASTGVMTPVPGSSPGFIPPNVIIGNIATGIDSLRRLAPALEGGVLVGVVDVPNAPRFFPGGALFAGAGPSELKASIDQITGRSVTVLPNCVGSTALISSIIVEQIKAGTYPPLISCAPVTLPGVPEAAALGNLFVLDATEQAQLSGEVAAVNAYLQAKADSLGWAYYDPNNETNGLPALKAAGAIRTVPDFTDAAAPFGPFISTDGVHPRAPAHVALANAIIGVINAQYGSSIPTIAP